MFEKMEYFSRSINSLYLFMTLEIFLKTLQIVSSFLMLVHGFCHLSSCTFSSWRSSFRLLGHPSEPWPGMNCAVFLKLKIYTTEALNIKRRKNLIGTGITQLDSTAIEIICRSSMFHNSISLLCFL